MAISRETRKFEAETKQLLDLMIHSLYTNKEIFLRELISNASDALDKLRFGALTKPDLVAAGEELEIRLEPENGKRTLTIHDNGIGMSRKEVIDNIGSIARSGTQEQIARLSKKGGKDSLPELIGRFGVGFYSAFMVAEKVELDTLKAGAKTAVHWESDAGGTYTISEGTKRSRGTSVTLHLKPVDQDAGIEDFTLEWILSRTVKRYSNFIGYPIRHKVRREERESDEKGILRPDGETTIVFEDKTLNSMKPIWTRPEADVKEEEYNEFYKHVTSDWNDPMLRLRFKAEGISEYESLLFIPAERPRDLHTWDAKYGLQLYARRVMVMEQCDAVLPEFLRFVRGVVDSSDLPLNISRQTLQENRHLTRIQKFLAKKVLGMLSDLQSEDEPRYLEFWKQFGIALKEGIGAGADHQDRIPPLLLFESSADPDRLTTLKGYISRMKEGQDAIYYITGESRSIVENSPLMEAFNNKGYEVLFLTDPIDEFMVDRLPVFEGKGLQSAGQGEIDLEETDGEQGDQAKREDQVQEFSDLFNLLGKHLEESVKQVRLSSRLTTSPACLTIDKDDMSPQMERILRMANPDAPRQKRILEVNASHAVVRGLRARFEKDKTDPELKSYAELLYGYALLAEGTELKDPGSFNKALEGVMIRAVHETAPEA